MDFLFLFFFINLLNKYKIFNNNYCKFYSKIKILIIKKPNKLKLFGLLLLL